MGMGRASGHSKFNSWTRVFTFRAMETEGGADDCAARLKMLDRKGVDEI